MFKSITKRDLKFFAFGILTMIALDLLLNLTEAKHAFLDGYNNSPK
jgi:hypothetical protein